MITNVSERVYVVPGHKIGEGVTFHDEPIFFFEAVNRKSVSHYINLLPVSNFLFIDYESKHLLDFYKALERYHDKEITSFAFVSMTTMKFTLKNTIGKSYDRLFEIGSDEYSLVHEKFRLEPAPDPRNPHEKIRANVVNSIILNV